MHKGCIVHCRGVMGGAPRHTCEPNSTVEGGAVRATLRGNLRGKISRNEAVFASGLWSNLRLSQLVSWMQFCAVLQAASLYDAVEASGGFYNAPVVQDAQSRMNVPFTIPSNSELEATFLKEASAAGFVRPPSHFLDCSCWRHALTPSQPFFIQKIKTHQKQFSTSGTSSFQLESFCGEWHR
jgi:hypothetical protein